MNTMLFVWIMLMTFSMIIHNLTILPSMGYSVRSVIAFVTLALTMCFIYLLIDHNKFWEDKPK